MSFESSGGGGSGAGLKKYADQASLPGVAGDGDAAVTLDTNTVWIYDVATSSWQIDGSIRSMRGSANGLASLDSSALVPVTQLPPAALERLVVVANQAARFALTTAQVQNGDTVKQTDTGEMWFVKDDTQLGSSAGYAVYTAGTASAVDWSGVLNKPAPVTALSGTNTGDQTITLGGDLSGSGSGALSATVESVGGSSKANIHSAELAANAATSAKTAGAIVKRDGSGAAALDVTGNLTGNADTATHAGTATNIDGSFTGDVSNAGMATTVQSVGGSSAANVHAAEVLANTAQSGNKVLASPANGSSGAPGFRALTGADLPQPTSTTLGGVKSKAAQATKFLTEIATDGTPGNAQPNFSDLAGSIAASQTAALTGDVTKLAGANPTVIPAHAIDNARMAQMAAQTIKGNASAALADPTDITVTALNALLGTSGAAKNYMGANPSAEDGTTGWATYADAAGNIPVDGTGGTATGLTFARSTSSPLRGSASFLMSQANSTSLQGMGVSYDFDIDSADQGRMLQIKFDYLPSSTFVASNGTTAPLNDGTTTTNAGNSDVEVFIYDKTNGALVWVSPQVLSGTTGLALPWRGVFQTSSNSTAYRLILHVATASANATGWTLKLDNFYVGPQNIIGGPAMSDSQSYTPTGSWVGGTATYSGRWRRIGEMMEVEVKVAVLSTPTSATLTVSLPSGYSIDTTKLNSSSVSDTTFPSVGRVVANGGGYIAVAAYNNTTSVKFLAMATVTQASPAAFIAGDSVVVSFLVPIAGWSANTQWSADSDQRIISFSGTAPGGAVTANTTNIPFTANTDKAGAWNGSQYVVPQAGDWVVSGSVNAGAAQTSSVYLNGVYKGDFSTASASGYFSTGSVLLQDLKPGDLISVRTGSSVTITAGGRLYIFKLAGPALVQASEGVGARYYGAPSTLGNAYAAIAFSTKDFDTHNSYSGSTYTIQTPGRYHIDACLNVSFNAVNNEAFIAIYKNGAAVSEDAFMTTYTGGAVTLPVRINDSLDCKAGDTIQIYAKCGGTPSIAASNTFNRFAIAKVG